MQVLCHVHSAAVISFSSIICSICFGSIVCYCPLLLASSLGCHSIFTVFIGMSSKSPSTNEKESASKPPSSRPTTPLKMPSPVDVKKQPEARIGSVPVIIDLLDDAGKSTTPTKPPIDSSALASSGAKIVTPPKTNPPEATAPVAGDIEAAVPLALPPLAKAASLSGTALKSVANSESTAPSHSLMQSPLAAAAIKRSIDAASKGPNALSSQATSTNKRTKSRPDLSTIDLSSEGKILAVYRSIKGNNAPSPALIEALKSIVNEYTVEELKSFTKEKLHIEYPKGKKEVGVDVIASHLLKESNCFDVLPPRNHVPVTNPKSNTKSVVRNPYIARQDDNGFNNIGSFE